MPSTRRIGTPGGTPERPATFFTGPEEFRAWLEDNHQTETELWMGLYKKHVPERGLTWEDAVVEALCFGWIDSAVDPAQAGQQLVEHQHRVRGEAHRRGPDAPGRARCL